MEIIKYTILTIISWLDDTAGDFAHWMKYTAFGRWFRELTPYKQFIATHGFFFLLGVTLMYFGQS